MKQRVSVKEAAKLLNISEAAVRQRIQRDSIAHERDEESNRIYVILDEVDGGLNNGDTEIEHSYARELIDTLREQLEAERESNRENRRIIAALTSRIPQLEAPQEPRDSPVAASENGGDDTPNHHQETLERRSWLYRFFFGP